MADADQGAFVAVSAILAGRQALDAMQAKRLYDALTADDSGFPAAARASLALINERKIDPLALQKALDDEHSPLAAMPRKIVTAWCMGTAGDCIACHTPRNILMAENLSRELGSWHAPNITSDANSGVGGWSEQEIADYVRLGPAANKAPAAGPMAEAVDNSLRHLTDGDLRAIAVYLKSVPAQHDAADAKATYAWGAAADDLNRIRGVALPTDPNQMTDPQLYDAQCATCHQARGQGSFDGGLPPLFHNTALGRTNTNNLVMVMLDGIQRKTDSDEVLMPGLKKELSDQQIATLGNYLTRNFGNPAAAVSVDQVKTLRAGGSSSNLVTVDRVGMGAFIIVVIVAIFGFGRRKRRKVQGSM
ncbi:sugar dehydrogenase complex small subunit [Collimonas antrihumi]|uniref:sugar dehydrogenase complex small subunit n=1 Tax=Collimonas antrihumi TaxID=1940615 RepID=UPI001B8B1170|nr:sugar dehydrogenase complex small subunit [Collimonas antrihumi]